MTENKEEIKSWNRRIKMTLLSLFKVIPAWNLQVKHYVKNPNMAN